MWMLDARQIRTERDTLTLAHCCTIFLCHLDLEKYRSPNDNKKIISWATTLTHRARCCSMFEITICLRILILWHSDSKYKWFWDYNLMNSLLKTWGKGSQSRCLFVLLYLIFCILSSTILCFYCHRLLFYAQSSNK